MSTQAIINRVWTKLADFPGWVYQDSGYTSTVHIDHGELTFGPSPNGWRYTNGVIGQRIDPDTVTTFDAGAVYIPENIGEWVEVGRSSLMEWTDDGRLFIDGVQEPGYHDLP